VTAGGPPAAATAAVTLPSATDPPIVAQGRPLLEWDWVVANLDRIGEQTLQHLVLTAVPVGAGLAISLVLAVITLRWRRLYGPIAAAGGVLYTIPSLAAFALLVPFFGLSMTTAVVALTSYTILILLRNIVTGIDGVPAEVREAATGMGYRRSQVLWRVELPIALPVIVAGLRIATVTVVGLVTVTALLGLGGLGRFILDGFRRSIVLPTEILVGTVLAVVLAALLDLALLGIQRALTPWARRT
jgi:osmoprotectant transport system permease protein